MNSPLPWLFALEQFGIKFGLENISAIVERLGHPERAFRSIHIAGTNGKGSVTAMVDAALRDAGHRSARFTSPHLVDLSERFVIDGRPVNGDALAAAIDDVRMAIDDLRAHGRLDVQPTFFEVTTAVAFLLFQRAGVDVAVLEVGLGGRLDATNVVTPPALVATAITSIAFDHQLYLGTTLREIALEKAGIIKPGVPVVVGPLDPEAETNSLMRTASRYRGAQSRQVWRTQNGRAASRSVASSTDASFSSMPRTTRPAPLRSRPISMRRAESHARSFSPPCAIRMSWACSRLCCRPSAV